MIGRGGGATVGVSSSSSPALNHAGQELAPYILLAEACGRKPAGLSRTGCYGVIGPDPSAVLDKFK